MRQDRRVTSWTCPECHRRFGRRNQGHDSAGDVDDDVRAWLAEAYLDSPE
jgi:hypothetical protein